MATNKLPKILITALFLLFTHVSLASDLEQIVQTLLAEKRAAAKVVAEKEAAIETVKEMFVIEQAKKKTGDGAAAKSATDKKQDAKIAALEAGILDATDLTGDNLKFKTAASPFKPIGSEDKFCAPVNSKGKVKRDGKDGKVRVNFKYVPVDSTSNCNSPIVRKGVQYTIEKDKLNQFNYNRKGIVYGGLIVPFKYYLGGDKRISASSTVAPYIGVRGLGHFWGLHVTPIVSAGLGLVPVNKMTTGEDGMVSTASETKSALSFATGLVLTHEKNKAFTAGILFGKDFLSTADRLSDPTVDKIWTSLYIGLSVGGSK